MALVNKRLFAQGLKRCNSCKQVLLLAMFGSNRSTSDGLMYQCKACRADNKKIDRKHNPERFRTANRRWLEKAKDNPPGHWGEGICKCCETPFRRRNRGVSENDSFTFCSRDCAFAWKTFVSERRKPASVSILMCQCEQCGSRFTSQRAAKYCGHECAVASTRAKPTQRICAWCGKVYEAIGRRLYCGPECQKAALKSSDTYRACKAKHRKARKLKKRGVTVETIDPLKVLARDGWICQLCGIKTPKRLRGTFEDNAPEVDHIVTLADGGEHSYANTQCACRKCNNSKSAKSRGQLRLIA